CHQGVPRSVGEEGAGPRGGHGVALGGAHCHGGGPPRRHSGGARQQLAPAPRAHAHRQHRRGGAHRAVAAPGRGAPQRGRRGEEVMAGGASSGYDDEEGGGAVIGDINVTPLVDITLVLLIIMMVAAPLIVNNPSIKVELPKAANGDETQKSTISL